MGGLRGKCFKNLNSTNDVLSISTKDEPKEHASSIFKPATFEMCIPIKPSLILKNEQQFHYILSWDPTLTHHTTFTSQTRKSES